MRLGIKGKQVLGVTSLVAVVVVGISLKTLHNKLNKLRLRPKKQ